MGSPWEKPREWLAERVDVAVRDKLLVRKPRQPRDFVTIMAQCEAALAAPQFAGPELFGPVGVTGVQRKRGRGPEGAELIDLRYQSAHPLVFEELRGALDRHPANREAQARLFLHPERARPAVILVHGYFGGVHALESRFWEAEALFARGLHVALFVLPFHGARKGRSPLAPPAWPHGDFRRTLEGFRQAVHELRGLRQLLAEEGASAVGAMGMSLGGYTTALFATAEPELAFVAPVAPLASFPDFYLANGQLPGSAEEQRQLHVVLERLHAPISPLARPVLVPEGARMVFAGAYDKITPLGHAEKIATHFGVAPTVFPGGHLMQVGRREAMESLFAMLEERGLLGR